MASEKVYRVVFVSGGYRCVDFETTNYEQAQEVKRELTNDMYLSGERDFCYIIETIYKKG